MIRIYYVDHERRVYLCIACITNQLNLHPGFHLYIGRTGAQNDISPNRYTGLAAVGGQRSVASGRRLLLPATGH